MFNQALLLIYRLFLHRGGRKINWMEQYLDDDAGDAPSPDDIRNESNAYEIIFAEEHRPKLEQIYMELLNKMTGIPYGQCEDMFEALAFLQEISATALWKYHQNVGQLVEEFVRDYDRLDVPSERIRLYEEAKKLVDS